MCVKGCIFSRTSIFQSISMSSLVMGAGKILKPTVKVPLSLVLPNKRKKKYPFDVNSSRVTIQCNTNVAFRTCSRFKKKKKSNSTGLVCV